MERLQKFRRALETPAFLFNIECSRKGFPMLFRLLWIFFLYSFAGWVIETTVAIIKQKRFVNRGVLNGPLCTIYGVAAIVLSVTQRELLDNIPLLFVFSAIYATVIEWLAGYFLEKTNHGKWWDYSKIPLNLDGYICLPYSLLWGVLGVVAVKWINPFVYALYDWIPTPVTTVILWVLLGIFAVDALGTFYAIHHRKGISSRVVEANNRLAGFTRRFGNAIANLIQRRLTRAYPQIQERAVQGPPVVFAQGCSFYKISILFVVGSFLGDITETIFCRITAGVWMSRSSLVWGPFSVVWGLALAAGTLLMYSYRNRSDSFIFIFGTVIGGAYEYFCSVFTEICYGTVFWDYSQIPFNLGGRINLLYCFFWGIAAVIWLKVCYPLFSKWIEKIPIKPGKIITWVLVIFMAVNMVVSAAALARYSERAHGKPAENVIESILDERFDDERMQRIYPNAIQVK